MDVTYTTLADFKPVPRLGRGEPDRDTIGASSVGIVVTVS